MSSLLPKPSKIKFHYVTTDQSGVKLKIAAQYYHALKLDLKKYHWKTAMYVYGDGFSRIILSCMRLETKNRSEMRLAKNGTRLESETKILLREARRTLDNRNASSKEPTVHEK